MILQAIKKGNCLCLVISILAILASCQKVIDVKLKSSEEKIVIQGAVTDEKKPYIIRITKTVSFKESNDFPPVTGASVIIHDDQGNSEILVEILPGTYGTSTLEGIPGRTYTMNVKVGDQEYTATSKMPSPVNITGLEARRSDFGRDTVIEVSFKDPADVENYYRFIQTINGDTQPEIDIFDDELSDGTESSYTLFTDDEDVDLHKGDSVIVQLRSIDQSTYEFYRTAREAIGGSQSPANPNTNLNNGALGYFSAYSVTTDTLLIQ